MPNKPNQVSKDKSTWNAHATKPGPNSRAWKSHGIAPGSMNNVEFTNPESHVRRCGLCERDAQHREHANHWVWISEVGDWYPIPETGVQLLPRKYPPHHQNEHLEVVLKYPISKDRIWSTAKEEFEDGTHTAAAGTLSA
jgi:hypothetical protein